MNIYEIIKEYYSNIEYKIVSTEDIKNKIEKEVKYNDNNTIKTN